MIFHMASTIVPDPAAGSLIGYARVSTSDQHLETQIDALTKAGCVEIFSDVECGAKPDRNGLEKALARLQPGNTLCVTALDRLGRSLIHLVNTVTGLAERGVGFKSLRESIDTTSATGRLQLSIFSAFAEYEREIIKERTKAALAGKKRRGERIGRRRALNAANLDAARLLLQQGFSTRHVARVLKVGRSTLYRSLAEPQG
jgi:DNA invertase Pin-like site-specific DNA recombinase